MKLSIITITRNSRTNLQRTCESILSQTWQDYEWIAIDMSSSDGSANFMENYACDYLVSIPDGEIVEGMNVGLYMAKGEYVLFLNGGDYLYDKHVLESVFSYAEAEADIIYGDVLQECSEGVHKKPLRIITPECINNPLILIYKHFLKQGALVRKSLFDAYGEFDTSYTDLVEMKQFIVFVKHAARFQKVNVLISGVDYTNIKKRKRERIKKELDRLDGVFPSALCTAGVELWSVNIFSLPLLTLRIASQRRRYFLLGWIPIYSSNVNRLSNVTSLK